MNLVVNVLTHNKKSKVIDYITIGKLKIIRSFYKNKIEERIFGIHIFWFVCYRRYSLIDLPNYRKFSSHGFVFNIPIICGLEYWYEYDIFYPCWNNLLCILDQTYSRFCLEELFFNTHNSIDRFQIRLDATLAIHSRTS